MGCLVTWRQLPWRSLVVFAGSALFAYLVLSAAIKPEREALIGQAPGDHLSTSLFAGAGGRVYSPVLYGGAGDGVSDDTTPLRRAFRDAASTGGVVWIPPGRWKLSGVITQSTSQPLAVWAHGAEFVEPASGAATIDLTGLPSGRWDGGTVLAGGHTGPFLRINSATAVAVRGLTTPAAKAIPVQLNGCTQCVVEQNFAGSVPWPDGKRFSVRDHGAAGDGVTDDTAAIQAAMTAAANAGGGVVEFPAGTYLMSSAAALTGANDVHLVGPAATILHSTRTPAGTLNFTSCNRCSVRLGTCDGADSEAGVISQVQSLGANIPTESLSRLVTATTCTDFEVTVGYTLDKECLAQFQSCTRAAVRRCLFRGVLYAQTLNKNPSGGSDDERASRSAYAVFSQGGDGIEIEENHCYGASALYITGSSVLPQRHVVRHNRIWDCYDEGIYFTGHDSIVAENLIWNIWIGGLRCNGSRNIVTHNQCFNSRVGIDISGTGSPDSEGFDGHGVSVTDNIVYDCGIGIEMGASSGGRYLRDVEISSNQVVSCGFNSWVGTNFHPVRLQRGRRVSFHHNRILEPDHSATSAILAGSPAVASGETRYLDYVIEHNEIRYASGVLGNRGIELRNMERARVRFNRGRNISTGSNPTLVYALFCDTTRVTNENDNAGGTVLFVTSALSNYWTSCWPLVSGDNADNLGAQTIQL